MERPLLNQFFSEMGNRQGLRGTDVVINVLLETGLREVLTDPTSPSTTSWQYRDIELQGPKGLIFHGEQLVFIIAYDSQGKPGKIYKFCNALHSLFCEDAESGLEHTKKKQFDETFERFQDHGEIFGKFFVDISKFPFATRGAYPDGLKKSCNTFSKVKSKVSARKSPLR